MQAQRNMVQVNEQRVAALQELDAAYDRIAELGTAAMHHVITAALVLQQLH